MKYFAAHLFLKFVELATVAEAILVLVVFFVPKTFYIEPPTFASVAQAEEIPAPSLENHAEVEIHPKTDIWAGYPLLKRIAGCESLGDPQAEPIQFNEDGSVLHGHQNSGDIGMTQINAPLWEAKAISLGFDIYTAEGNLGMAEWIFNHYGSQPWFWSEHCWGAKKYGGPV